MSGDTYEAPTLAFFEGAIGLDALFKDKPKPCISNFLAETRSSDTLSADLKDYVHGKFERVGLGSPRAAHRHRPMAATSTTRPPLP